MKNLADLPATKEYMKEFANQVFSPIFQGQSTAMITVPNFGSNSFVKYILGYSENIDKELKSKLATYRFLELNLRGIEEVNSIWEQLSLQIGSKSSTKEKVIKELSNIQKDRLVIIINGIDEVFSLDIVKSTIAAIYSSISSLLTIGLYYGEPKNEYMNFLTTNLRINSFTYIIPRSNEDMSILLEKEERWFIYKLEKKVKEKIIELSGGYSSLARGLLALALTNQERFITFTNDELVETQEVKTWLHKLYFSMAEQSQQILQKLVVNPKLNIDNSYLANSGLLIDGRFFTPLFRIYIENLAKDDIKLHSKDDQLYLGEQKLSEIFTNQEELVFNYFWDKADAVISREEIANVMWAGNANESYSDWAIDKIISKIRDKILDDDKTLIQTIKGKGFKLTIKNNDV